MVLQIITATPETAVKLVTVATAALGRVLLLKVLSWTYVMMDRAPAKASSQAGWICSSGSRWLNSPGGSCGEGQHIVFGWWMHRRHVPESPTHLCPSAQRCKRKGCQWGEPSRGLSPSLHLKFKQKAVWDDSSLELIHREDVFTLSSFQLLNLTHPLMLCDQGSQLFLLWIRLTVCNLLIFKRVFLQRCLGLSVFSAPQMLLNDHRDIIWSL